jgi:two-component system chemotaxis response regulator CheY
LLVTSEAEKENVTQAVQAGVNDYIVKPFTADIIKQKIR